MLTHNSKYEGTIALGRDALPKYSPSQVPAVIIIHEQLSANYLSQQCLIKLKPAGCHKITNQGNTAPGKR